MSSRVPPTSEKNSASLENEAIASQFSIKRLMWMVFVAAVFLKLAQLSGISDFFKLQWQENYGVGSGWVLLIVGATVSVGLVYVGWFGIRLPYLLARYREIRNRRLKRRAQLEAEVDATKKLLK